jgi:hypothetical protein
VVNATPPRPAAEDLGWPRIQAMNDPLAMDADTIACQWDGKPVDYGTIVRGPCGRRWALTLHAPNLRPTLPRRPEHRPLTLQVRSIERDSRSEL